MQELEKVLEEIDNRVHFYDNADEPMMYVETVKDIIRKHMNGCWIPVVRGLPELNEDELSEDVLISFSDSYNICIGFYGFNEKRWYVHGSGPCIGRVVAWRPLPEPYHPERSENHDGE